MDQQNKPDNEPIPSNGNVMDVTAPTQPEKSTGVPPTNSWDVNDSSADSGDASQMSGDNVQTNNFEPPSLESNSTPDILNTDPIMAQAPAPEPETTSINVTNSDASSVETNSSSPESAHEQTPAGDSHPVTTPLYPHHKKGMPVIALVIAVIVAVGIAGLVIYTYMKTNNDGEINREDSTTSVEKLQANSEDVDITIKEIDASVTETSDEKDFPSEELSDTSLGL